MRRFAGSRLHVLPGESVMKPPDDGLNHIFKSEDGFTFNEVLVGLNVPKRSGRTCYNPEIDPVDPGLGGKGTEFSSIMGGRAARSPNPPPCRCSE